MFQCNLKSPDGIPKRTAPGKTPLLPRGHSTPWNLLGICCRCVSNAIGILILWLWHFGMVGGCRPARNTGIFGIALGIGDVSPFGILVLSALRSYLAHIHVPGLPPGRVMFRVLIPHRHSHDSTRPYLPTAPNNLNATVRELEKTDTCVP